MYPVVSKYGMGDANNLWDISFKTPEASVYIFDIETIKKNHTTSKIRTWRYL